MKQHEAELRKNDEKEDQDDQKKQTTQQLQRQSAETTDTEHKGERVLALIENPTSKEFGIRQERLIQLEKENRQLLDMLEATSSPSEDEPRKRQRLEEQDPEQASAHITVPQTSLDNLRRKAEILTENLANKDKRIMRLHQVTLDCEGV